MKFMRMSGSSVLRYASVGRMSQCGSVAFKNAAFSEWQDSVWCGVLARKNRQSIKCHAVVGVGQDEISYRINDDNYTTKES